MQLLATLYLCSLPIAALAVGVMAQGHGDPRPIRAALKVGVAWPFWLLFGRYASR